MPRRSYPIGTILFLLFSAFTLLELWILVLLARATSLGFAILLAIVTAIVGASLAKHEGLAVLRRAQQELAQGRIPAQSLADGVIILIGGALLIAPGLITDLIGLSTLLPFCRKLYSKIIINWAKRHFAPQGAGGAAGGGFRFYSFTGEAKPSGPQAGPGTSPGEGESPEVRVLDPDRERRLREWREQVRQGTSRQGDNISDAEIEESDRPRGG